MDIGWTTRWMPPWIRCRQAQYRWPAWAIGWRNAASWLHGVPTTTRRQARAACTATPGKRSGPVAVLIIVVDGEDAQTEHAGGALSGQPRVRIIWLPRRAGAAQARNVSIEAAQGDWLALLDYDDEWLPDKLQCQSRLAVASPP